MPEFQTLPLATNLGLMLISAAVVWIAGTRLSYFADAIAVRAVMGRAFASFASRNRDRQRLAFGSTELDHNAIIGLTEMVTNAANWSSIASINSIRSSKSAPRSFVKCVSLVTSSANAGVLAAGCQGDLFQIVPGAIRRTEACGNTVYSITAKARGRRYRWY